MHPQGKLTELALRKDMLRTRIALERAQCTRALSVVCQPVALADQALAGWRRLSPTMRWLAIPLGGMTLRWLVPTLLRRKPALPGWLTVLFGILARHALRP
jgi:hypothetical protein